jgi:subtilase family serine protease
MKTKLLSMFFLAGILASAAAIPALSLLTPSSSGLQFVPLIQVAPDDNSTATITNPACTSPAPVHTSADYHCYTPSDIYAAYDVASLHVAGIEGQGQTIVIVDSYGSPTALNDLQFFSSTFGLPVPNMTGGPTLRIIHPSGTPTPSLSMRGVQLSWGEETSLDLQWSHAMAPMANIVLIAANPAETEGVQGFPSIFAGEEYAIQHYPGSVLSQSFAVTEQSFKSAGSTQVALFDKVYKMAAANYVTVLGSAGDSGTANVVGGQGASSADTLPYPTVNWPSSDPLVTSAGGTWLQYGWTWNPSFPTDLTYSTTPGSRTEAVWNEPFLPAATGGGLSVLFPTPSFQGSISQSVLEGARGLPDLSWNAAVDGGVLVYTSFAGVRVGWHTIGGTSAASPQLAGLVALANQLADSLHKSHHVGYLNPILYTLPSSDFNDIVPQTFGSVTISDNSLYGSGIPGYPATTGWDLASGFGSPIAFNFVHDLANALP